MKYVYRIGKADGNALPARSLTIAREREFRAEARRILSRGNTRTVACLGLIVASAAFVVLFILIVTVYILVFGGEDGAESVSWQVEAAAAAAALIIGAPLRAGYVAAASSAAGRAEGLEPSDFFSPFESLKFFFRLTFAENLRTFSIILPALAAIFLCGFFEEVSPALIVFAGVALCFPFAIITRRLRLFAVSALAMRNESLREVREKIAGMTVGRRKTLNRLDFVYLLSLYLSACTAFILSFAHTAHLFSCEFASVLSADEETD